MAYKKTPMTRDNVLVSDDCVNRLISATIDISRVSAVDKEEANSDNHSDVLQEDLESDDLDGANASLTTVLKEEIKYTIQTKRLQRGLTELRVEPYRPKGERLTQEEIERRDERRERNRAAATKCRNKKRERMQVLEKETQKLTTQNESLLKQIDCLHKEKEELTFLLNTHLIHCPQRSVLNTHRDG
ncbi:cyclic AMP-dependent transcription factor ATF-3-like isoform X2 [Glandiceps talaboti]